MSYSYKEKQKHFNDLRECQEHVQADIELLEKKSPAHPQLTSYKRAPERKLNEVLYELLDFATREEIVANRRSYKSPEQLATEEEAARLAAEEAEKKAAEEAARLAAEEAEKKAAEEAARLAAEEAEKKAAEEAARLAAEEAAEEAARLAAEEAEKKAAEEAARLAAEEAEKHESLQEEHETLKEEHEALQEENEDLQAENEELQEQTEALQEKLAEEKKKEPVKAGAKASGKKKSTPK